MARPRIEDSKKKDNLVQVYMDDSEIILLDKIRKENGLNRGAQLRMLLNHQKETKK